MLLPGFTSTYTVDAVGNPEPITVNTTCRRVVVGENYQAGTVDFKIRRPSITSSPVGYSAGIKIMLESPPGTFFNPGDIIAYIETVSGSATFTQEEE